MSKQLLTNKFLLIGLSIVALVGLLIISYNAVHNASPTVPFTQTFQPKTATLPPAIKDHPISGQLIIKFKPQYSNAQINTHLQQYHASVIKTIEGINQTVIKVPAGRENTIMQQLKTDPYVETAQRDITTHAFFTPNDPEFALQYALNNSGQTIQGQAGKAHADMNIETAWDVTKGTGIKVAILDTGINLNHPDLAGKVILQKSFVSNTVEDGNGHGTHVAGILAADTNNGTGIAGTCPDCQLIIGKVLDDTGNGSTSNTTAGITWAADNGAKIINVSLGTSDSSTQSLYAEAVNYAMSKGAVVVAASGNCGGSDFIQEGCTVQNEVSYPAGIPGVVSVAATTNTDQKASYSNSGSSVQIAAPGENILSTAPTHSFQLMPFGYSTSLPYMYLSGTSMATPYVSGVAALIASTSFGTTPQRIINRLYATADKISGTGTDWINGRVDAAAAVGPAPTVTLSQPSEITPTLFCIGGNGVPPCATIPPSGPTIVPPASGNGTSPSTAAGNPNPSSTNPSVSPTPEGVVNPSLSPSPVASNPSTTVPACFQISSAFYNLASQSQLSTSSKTHIKCSPRKSGDNQDEGNGNPNNGWLSQLFQVLLQLLQLLLQLISNCVSNPSTETPTPTVSPAVSLLPSSTISP